jgi:hypothetical protein
MITIVRTGATMPGKIGEVIPIAKEIAAIVKRIGGKDLQIGIPVGGNFTEIAWIGQYDSTTQFEDVGLRCAGDPEYRACIKKLETLLVPGTARDQIWRHV